MPRRAQLRPTAAEMFPASPPQRRFRCFAFLEMRCHGENDLKPFWIKTPSPRWVMNRTAPRRIKPKSRFCRQHPLPRVILLRRRPRQRHGAVEPAGVARCLGIHKVDGAVDDLVGADGLPVEQVGGPLDGDGMAVLPAGISTQLEISA